MNFRTVAASFAALSLSVGVSAQTYYIDPDSPFSINDPFAGTMANPFKTISYALTQPVTGSLELRLLPGTYSAASGESFPIDLPEDVTVIGTSPGCAILDHRGATGNTATPALRVMLQTPGTNVLLQDFDVVGDQIGIYIEATAHTHFVELFGVRTTMEQSVWLGSGVGSHIVSNGTSNAPTINYFEFQRESFDEVVGCELENRGSGSLYPTIASSYFEGRGADVECSGYLLRGIGLADFEMKMASSIVRGYRNGIETIRGSAPMTLLVEHCGFYQNGRVVPGGTQGGAIRESIGQMNQCVVQFSAFWEDAVDLADYSPASYAVVENVIQDPQFDGVNGNVSGDPMWVDPFLDDFHILPGSPCYNATAGAVAVTFDMEGDARGVPCSFSREIGPDESHQNDIYLRGRGRGVVGQDIVMGLYGDGGSIAVVGNGPQTGATCGVPIDPAAFELLTTVAMPGTPGMRAFKLAGLPVPNNPVLIGATANVGAAFLTPTGAVAATNARAVTFCN